MGNDDDKLIRSAEDLVERLVTSASRAGNLWFARVESEAAAAGIVWVDVSNGRTGVTIECREGSYGLSSLPSEGQGEGARVVLTAVDAVIDHVRKAMSEEEGEQR